jgi:putative toxin-antitoxin system antitoxin component (TIGR02293 family)
VNSVSNPYTAKDGDPMRSAFVAPRRILSARTARSLEEQYNLTAKDVAEVLEVTPKTLTRWSQKDKRLSLQQSDRIAILESIFALGKRVLGSSKNVGEWIHGPVLYLNGQKPIDLLKLESGRRNVESALNQIEFGMY